MSESENTYALPGLPYPRHALEPWISRDTLLYHHDRHHRAYVSSLNQLIVGSPLKGAPLETVVKKADGKLFNSAAQAWNHTFYWHCLSPDKTSVRGPLKDALERHFGSVSGFLEAFRSSAMAQFGSGWTWLVADAAGALTIENTGNADTPLRRDKVPLVVCDIWEHAYYIDYRNERARYVDAFLGLINWTHAEEHFAAIPRAWPAEAIQSVTVNGD
ncbi:MAG: superoxide dismutase [Armatimonadota bacterium]